MGQLNPWEKNWEVAKENIGEGGQGTTHLVQSRANAQLAVLKVLKEVEDPQARKRMKLEVVALQTLAEYGAMVPIPLEDNFDCVNEMDVPLYFVMQHVEGRTLDEFIKEEGSVDLPRAVEIVERISETIAIGHREKLLHRDLKPKNVILGEDSNGRTVATVLDYGISFNNLHDNGLTTTDESFWNEFLSLPETNVQGNDRRDFRTDVTALCGLLFFCLSGRYPQLLLDGEAKQPHRRRGVQFVGISDDKDEWALLNAIFSRGFRPHVNDRFQSVEEFLSQLKLLERRLSSEDESIAAAARRNSELIRLHDRTTQLVKIKAKVPKIHEKLTSAINTVTKDVDLEQFQIKARNEKLSDHSGNAGLKLEWIHRQSFVRQLTVPPHNFIKEIGYCLGVNGEELHVLRYLRSRNPGKFGSPECLMTIPLDEEPEFALVVQDFKAWIIGAMDELRTEILATSQGASIS